MLLRKGIVRKTFLFFALLIVLVILISFAAMYFIMPGYYLAQKEKNLQNNLDSLAVSLGAASTDEECSALISAFSEANNINIFSFGKNETLLPMLSTPFVNMKGEGDTLFYAGGKTNGMDGGSYRIQIRTERIHVNDKVAVLDENDVQENGLAIKWAAQDRVNAISLQGTVGSDIVDYIVANGTLQPIDEAKSVILSLIPYVLVIAIAVELFLAGTYARQISKPILQISDAALRMQRMEPDAVSGIKTKDELGQLSSNLDALYASLLDNIDHLKTEMDKVNRLERSKTEMMQSA